MNAPAISTAVQSREKHEEHVFFSSTEDNGSIRIGQSCKNIFIES